MSIKILNENFLDLTLLANATVSSEQSSFPATNLYNAQRRSKVWRSAGYFSVTSSNNTFVFRETALTDLTATVTVADYNSDTTFFAAIKSALETTGASTYTVERDTTTDKIKITSNGSGGGGIFELIWTDVSSSGFAGITGFDTSTDDTGALNYTADELKLHTEEWVKWDFGISTNPQAFIMIGARNAPLKVSSTATIKLQANETDVWTSPSYEQTLTYDESVISLFKAAADTGLHTQALRFWRLQIIDQDNPEGHVEVGGLFLGDEFTAARGAVQFPLSSSWVDRSATVFSEGGQTFSDIREKTESFRLNWFGLNIADRESFDEIFDDVGTSRPFFISLDPNAVYSTSVALFIRYVKFESAPTWRLESPGNFSSTFTLREEL